MGQQFSEISDKIAAFIARQPVFFAATATSQSRINLSPREGAAFRVVGPNHVLYLDRTGSGSETLAHVAADGRMTIMFCAFEGPPQILRLYGQARLVKWSDPAFEGEIATHFGTAPLGTRQLVHLDVDLVQTSCGYGVPLLRYEGDRNGLENWAQNKGPEGIRTYWEERNQQSIDGLPTGLLD